MRLTIVTNWLRTSGGSEKITALISNYLNLNGGDVSIVALYEQAEYPQQIINKQIPVTYLCKNNSLFLAFIRLWLWYFNKKPEVVFASNHFIAGLLVIYRFISNKKCKIIFRNINNLSYLMKDKGVFKISILKRLLCQTDCVIAQCNGMKVDLVSNWGFKSNNIVVIKNPVFITEEVDINRAEVATNKLLFVGRLADQKGLYYLFKALEILHSKNIDFSIDLIGEGVLKQPLQQFALNSGFANKVNFWGYKNETKSFYENSKVTILSSIYEGFPNVILESLANGVPVVSFKTPFGPEELIVDGVNGYLANYLDVNDLAKMIEKCLLTNWKREKVIQTVADYAADKVLCKYRELLLKM